MSAGATDKIALPNDRQLRPKSAKQPHVGKIQLFFVCFLLARTHFCVCSRMGKREAVHVPHGHSFNDWICRGCDASTGHRECSSARFFFPLFCVFRDSKARRAAPYRSFKSRKSVKSAAMGLSPSRTINIISLAASLELQRAPGSPLGMFWSLSCSRGRDGCAGLFILLICHAGSM